MAKQKAAIKRTRITFNLTEEERLLLIEYCEQTGRDMTEILRELIRNLKIKTVKDKV